MPKTRRAQTNLRISQTRRPATIDGRFRITEQGECIGFNFGTFDNRTAKTLEDSGFEIWETF
jgi:hypothetical protein